MSGNRSLYLDDDGVRSPAIAGPDDRASAMGAAPDWAPLTPDSRTAYVANAGSNSVSVVDIKTMKEVARIPVGQVPKRNATAMLQVQ